MNFLRVYRGVKNVVPTLLGDYHSAPINSGRMVGNGMYFAFNKEEAMQYIKTSAFDFATVGVYVLQGQFKVFDDSDIEDPIMKKLFDAQDKIEELIKSKNLALGAETLPEGAVEFWTEEGINQWYKNMFQKMDDKVKDSPEFKKVHDELSELYDLSLKMVNAIHEQRQNFDVSIYQYKEVCVHNPEVNLELESFDLFLKSEEEAKTIFDHIKTGQLEGTAILGIPEDHAWIVEKALKERQL